MEKVRIPLESSTYDVLLDWGFLGDLGRVIKERGIATDNAAVFTSPRVGDLYYSSLHRGLEEAGFSTIGRFDIPDGEEYKNWDYLTRAVQWLAEFTSAPGLRPVVVNLGGGVVGDLGGCAAALFRRGVSYVQVPTTLLALVDCCVGGKVGVNLQQGKNLVGTFHQPKLVFADLATLRTLKKRQLRSGVAEVIKYGAVLDTKLFELLEDAIEALLALDMNVVMHVAKRCLALKRNVIKEDELDANGKRVCLNFGHTLGHAVEKAAADFCLLHGECVAIGMVAAARISVELGLCDVHVLNRLENLIVRAGLPTYADAVQVESVLEYMAHDKKFITGRNRFVLLSDIGDWVDREGVPMDVIRTAAEAATRPTRVKLAHRV